MTNIKLHILIYYCKLEILIQDFNLELRFREFTKLPKFHKTKITCLTSINLKNIKSIVVGCDNGFIKIFDILNKKPTQLKNIGNGIAITALATISNLGNIVIATNDFKLILYSTPLAKVLYSNSAHEDTISRINYIPDLNQVITAGNDCTYKIWDSSLKTQLHAFYDCEDHIIASDYNSNSSTYACLDNSGNLVLRFLNNIKEHKITKINNNENLEYYFIKFNSLNDNQLFISTSKSFTVFDIRKSMSIDSIEELRGSIDVVNDTKNILSIKVKEVCCYSTNYGNFSLIKNYSLVKASCCILDENKDIFIGNSEGDFYYSMFPENNMIEGNENKNDDDNNAENEGCLNISKNSSN